MNTRLLRNAVLVVLALASLLATAAITAAVITGRTLKHEDASLPPMYELPRFTLTDERGQPFGTEQLRGKIWVADFMFTRCSGICPMLAINMKALQASLQDHPRWADIRLVSISVDPEHDTPTTLAEYAERHGAQAGQWVFLSGAKDQVWPLIEKGFKLTVEDDPGNAAMPYLHDFRFALVDGDGRIRAYHDGRTADGREALLADIEKLLAE
jgi:cytochrome oxidase Cu insertion factor (SCO1/SenC/PrrC family)